MIVSKKLLWLVCTLLLTGSCTLFSNKDGGSPTAGFMQSQDIQGAWVQERSTDLLVQTAHDLAPDRARVLLIEGDSYSEVNSIFDQENCFAKVPYRIEGRKLIVNSGQGEKSYLVKTIESETLILSQLNEEGTAVLDLTFRKEDTLRLQELFSDKRLKGLQFCSAFQAFRSGDDASKTPSSPDVFRPSIDTDTEFEFMTFTKKVQIPETNLHVSPGLIRVVREGGKSYRPGMQPRQNVYCELSFVNIGQIPAEAGSYVFEKGLRYRVLRSSRSVLSDSESGLDIIFDGVEMRCLNPKSANGIGFSAQASALGAEISVR